MARDQLITRDDIEAASARIKGRVRQTPVVEVEPAAFGLAVPLVLKLELLQHTGSFKPRGAFNRILAAAGKATRVIAASGGNHGLGVAYAARAFGLPAEIFVPETSSRVKVERLRALGADVTVTGRYYADAYAASQRRAREVDALVVHAYDQPEVAAGQGTLGRELAAQVPDLDTVLVAVGGGGLLAGVATWFSQPRVDGAPAVRVVAVETERTPTLTRALAAGEPVDLEVGGVAADSLGARRIGAQGFGAATRSAIQTLLVSDDAVMASRKALWDQLRIAAEPGGAAALAAVVTGAYRPEPGERVAVIICGGNTDPGDLLTS